MRLGCLKSYVDLKAGELWNSLLVFEIEIVVDGLDNKIPRVVAMSSCH